MKPTNSVAFAAPVLQLAPPPYSQPKSIVSVDASLLKNALRSSYHFTWTESSVWTRWRSGAPRTSAPITYWLKIRIRSPVGVYRTWPPNPGTWVERAYGCQPLTSHGSIFKRSLANHWTRAPLKYQGVFDDTSDGCYVQLSKL